MLTEERLQRIVDLTNAAGSITVTKLMEALNASESTIRRDLALLDNEQRLVRVRGGAIAIPSTYGTRDDEVVTRKGRHTEAKHQIAAYAAGLITDEDFVFLDAGTTTEQMIPFLSGRKTIFVTNDLSHAMQLSDTGHRVYILGGEFKNTTEAIVGEEALASLSKYNFTKGFFGVNGVHPDKGFTTPEIRESLLKQYAMSRCQTSYILADASKLGSIYAVSFGEFSDATIITDHIPEGFGSYNNIREVQDS